MGSQHTSTKRRKLLNNLPPDGMLETIVKQLLIFFFWN